MTIKPLVSSHINFLWCVNSTLCLLLWLCLVVVVMYWTALKHISNILNPTCKWCRQNIETRQHIYAIHFKSHCKLQPEIIIVKLTSFWPSCDSKLSMIVLLLHEAIICGTAALLECIIILQVYQIQWPQCRVMYTLSYTANDLQIDTVASLHLAKNSAI